MGDTLFIIQTYRPVKVGEIEGKYFYLLYYNLTSDTLYLPQRESLNPQHP